LTMFKHKLNCICNKNLFCYVLKPNIRKQKIKLHSNVKMQTMFIYIYENISPMNDFGIMILGYCIHFFDLVVFIWPQRLILSTPCNFQRLCRSKFACSNCLNKVFVLFKVCPCTLWDDPIPHAGIPMMLNKILEVKRTNKGRLICSISYA
jgi:hypothetical protein